MNKFLILLFAGCSLFTTLAAQPDSTVYINGLPVSDDDTVQNFPQTDLYPKTNLERVPKEQLPEKLRNTLNDDDTFKGWEELPVYYDRNTKLFTVQVKTTEEIRTYGFNENGKPVTYGVNSIDDQ